MGARQQIIVSEHHRKKSKKLIRATTRVSEAVMSEWLASGFKHLPLAPISGLAVLSNIAASRAAAPPPPLCSSVRWASRTKRRTAEGRREGGGLLAGLTF